MPKKKASQYCVSEVSLGDVIGLQADWLDLQRRADCSFFQSWAWIGTWLEQVAVDLPAAVIRVEWGGSLVGLCFSMNTRLAPTILGDRIQRPALCPGA